jgi:hypothetical protein
MIMPERPSMLTVVCVFSMVLGCLGLLTAGFAVISMIFGRMMMEQVQVGEAQPTVMKSPAVFSLAVIQVEEDAVSAAGVAAEAADSFEDFAEEQDTEPDVAADDPENGVNEPPDLGDMMAQQKKIQEAVMKVQEKWMVFLITFLVMQVVVCMLMSIGGLLGVLGNPMGRTLMLAGFAGVVVLEAGRLVPNYMIQQETLEVMAGAMDDLMNAMPQGGGPKIRMGGIMKIMSTVQTIVSAAWGVFKIAIFAWFFVYLRGNKEVRRYYGLEGHESPLEPSMG